MPINDVSSMNKQHAVPQNIMDVEFKIIGDLTLRQFAYLMLFGGVAFVAFTYVGGIFKWPVAIGAVLGGLGFAFVPIEDRGMDQWVVNFFKAVYSPTQKIWKKDAVVPSVFMYDSMQMVKQELITLAPTSSRRKLEEYLETQGRAERKVDTLDIPEADFAGKVHEAFQSYTPMEVPLATEVYATAAPATTTVVDEPVVAPVEFAPMPAPQPVQPAQDTKPDEPKPVETSETTTIAVPVAAVPALAPAPTPVPQPAQIQNKYNIKPVRKQHIEPELKLITRRDRDLSGPVLSPDRQAGRKFLNLSAEDAGHIILPIRGERKLKTSEEVNIEVDIKERTDQLNKLINQIKQEEGIKEIKKKVEEVPSMATSAVPGQPVGEMPEKEDVDIEANKVIESVKEQNTALTKEIESLKSKGMDDSAKQAQLQQLQVAKAKSDEEYSTLLKQLKDLQDKLKEKEQINPTSSPVNASAAVASTVVAPSKPNVVTGVVKNTQGLALEGIVLLVKNAKGEAVRALKTNAVGQFSLVSPLANGMYTVEVGPYNKVGLTFDIISVEAKGEIISPIEFVGR